MLGGAGELFFDGIAGAERHGHELADHAFFDAVAVQPRLVRYDQVVLRVAVEPLRPGVAGNGTDLAGGDLDRERIVGVAIEAEPHCFGLMHRQQHAAAALPGGREPVRVVVDVAQREAAEAGRQRVVAAVVRNAQRALEVD